MADPTPAPLSAEELQLAREILDSLLLNVRDGAGFVVEKLIATTRRLLSEHAALKRENELLRSVVDKARAFNVAQDNCSGDDFASGEWMELAEAVNLLDFEAAKPGAGEG